MIFPPARATASSTRLVLDTDSDPDRLPIVRWLGVLDGDASDDPMSGSLAVTNTNYTKDEASKHGIADGGAGQAHADAQLAAQVDGALGLFVPGVTARRRRLVPFLEDEPDVDVLLQAADPELLAVGTDQCADRGQRTTGGVRVDRRVMDPEHPPLRSDRYDQL